MPSEPNSGKKPDKRENPSVSFFKLIKTDHKFKVEIAAVLAGIAVLIVYACQLSVMQRQLRLDQRAWIGFTLPTTFPLDTPVTQATIQITDFGKTPAQQVEGDIVATVLLKSQEPAFDYSLGHPHRRFYAGVVFPNSPFPVTVNVLRYEGTPVVFSPDDLRKELESGQSYIVFYGQITYKDIFGKEHWTHFCTGSGKAMQELDTLKKCIRYNDVDGDI